MVPDARTRIEALSNNDTWLFDHMITAFWGGFGIANGLSIQKEDVEVIHYKEGPRGYRVKAPVMQAKLAEYLRWLESYQQKWGTETYQDITYVREGIYHSSLPGWTDITRMIELLQV